MAPGKFTTVLYKFCEEEDVLIIPEFLPFNPDGAISKKSPSKTKELKDFENSDLSQITTLNEECESRPPQITIAYENPEDEENPIKVICKNIYIEFSFIHAIEKSLSSFHSLKTLIIEDCCISSEFAEELVTILTNDSGKQILNLSLNGNLNITHKLPLFLSSSTGLKFLSFQRCGIDDEALKFIVEPLSYSDGRESKILVLNLGMNKIGNVGMLHLANALRTNRTLASVSLIGNCIGDEGAGYLIEILQKFPLTQSEGELRRRRIFDRILREKLKNDQLIEEYKGKGEIETQSSKTNNDSKKNDRNNTTVKKIRGPDGKMCLPGRERKIKLSKHNSRSRVDFEEDKKNMETEEQANSEILLDKHPFVSETSPGNEQYWCSGCWSILSLNLAYNYITEKSIEKFTRLLCEQNQNFKPPKNGLTRLILTPNYYVQDDSFAVQNFNSVILNRNSLKENFQLPLSQSMTSKSSPRRINSSTRKGNP